MFQDVLRESWVYQEIGQEFLEEHRRSVEDIWGRVGGGGWDPEIIGEMHEIRHELKDLARLFGRKMQAGRMDRDKLRRVREVIVKSVRDIEDILEEQEESGPAAGQHDLGARPPRWRVRRGGGRAGDVVGPPALEASWPADWRSRAAAIERGRDELFFRTGWGGFAGGVVDVAL